MLQVAQRECEDEEPHRSVSIQTVRLEENQFLYPTALHPSMPLDMVPRRGRKHPGHSKLWWVSG